MAYIITFECNIKTLFFFELHTIRPGMCIKKLNAQWCVSCLLVIGNYTDLEQCTNLYPNSRNCVYLSFLTPVSEDEQAESGMFD